MNPERSRFRTNFGFFSRIIKNPKDFKYNFWIFLVYKFGTNLSGDLKNAKWKDMRRPPAFCRFECVGKVQRGIDLGHVGAKRHYQKLLALFWLPHPAWNTRTKRPTKRLVMYIALGALMMSDPRFQSFMVPWPSSDHEPPMWFQDVWDVSRVSQGFSNDPLWQSCLIEII